jgi:streptomycin 6-kinase
MTVIGALPGNLAATAGAEPAVRAWAAELPSIVAEVAGRWSLELGAPFDPGGTASWVAPARTAAGATAVLKLAWRHYEADHEADGLRVWDGHGAVRLLDHFRRDEHTDALLLEACEPGTSAAMLPEPEQDAVVAGVLRGLWIEPPPGSPFRPLASMCAAWADELDVERAVVALADPGLVRAGVNLFRELGAQRPAAEVLLGTDLHAENVLAARREPWLAIDPKPYVGDPTYDPLQHLLNCPDRLVAAPVALIDRMAALLDLDRDRLARWTFARCVLASPDQPELAPVVRTLAPG